MRILPRSAKGTWLLVAAAWLSLCASIWWLLPVVPRVSWSLPEPSVLKFLAGGEELATRTEQSYPLGELIGLPPPREPDGPVRVWVARSGVLLRSYAPEDKTAPDLDPPFTDHPSGTQFGTVSRDRRVLVTSLHVGGLAREIGVWEVGSLRPMNTMPVPPGIKYVICRLNAAGTILAAGMTDIEYRDVGAFCWESASGRELFRVQDAALAAIGADGKTLLTFGDLTRDQGVGYSLSGWDIETGRRRFTLGLVCGGFILRQNSPLLSPDGRTIAAPTGLGPSDPLDDLARKLAVPWPFKTGSTGEAMTLFDATSGQEIGRVTGKFDDSEWSPDSKLLATLDEGRHLVRVWDIPPRKPLGWFAAAAAILALPFAGLAHRRVRRLRREAAAAAKRAK